MKKWNRFDFGDFEITKREILVSISIIAVLLLIGFIISGKITGHQTAYEWRWHHHCGTDGNSTAYHTVLIIHGRDH